MDLGREEFFSSLLMAPARVKKHKPVESASGSLSKFALTHLLRIHEEAFVNSADEAPPLQLPLIGKFQSRTYRSGSVRYAELSKVELGVASELIDQAKCTLQNQNVQLGLPVQMSEYRLGGGFYWHRDHTPLARDSRVAALIVQLSCGSDYSGGELQSISTKHGLQGHSKELGSFVIFSGSIWHRVRVIQGGVRKSAVFWLVPESL